MENSTADHQQHQQDPYSILNATKAYNEADGDLEAQGVALGKDRDALGNSIHNLQKTLDGDEIRGEVTRTNMTALLNQKQRDMKEVELNLDINTASRKNLSVSSFMGEGDNAPVDYSKMSRKNMTPEMKSELMKKLSLSEYMKIPFN